MAGTLRKLFATLGYKVDSKPLRKFNKELDEAKGKMRETGDQARDAKGRFTATKPAVDGLGGSMSSLKGIVVGLGSALAGLGLLELVRGIFEVNVEFERMSAALETVEGSKAGADAAFARIEKFAAKTPFDLQQVGNAFIKLKALGLDPSERALTSYGNTASAMGKDLNDMIEAVADASTGEFERLKEFGIKASSQGDKVKFTFQGVTTEVGKNADEIQNYLLNIGETSFAGGMDRQASTLGGVLSTFKDTVSSLAREIGQGGLNDAMRELLQSFTVGVGGGKTLARTIGGALASGLRTAASAVAFVVKHWKAFSAALAAAGVVAVITKIALFVAGMGGLKAIFAAVVAAASPFLAIIAKVVVPIAAAVAAVVALYLVIEDLYYYFTGGDSAIGKFIDKFRGAEGVVGDLARAAESFLPKLKAVFDALVDAGRQVFDAIKPVLADFVAFGAEIFGELKSAFGEVVSTMLGEGADGLDTLGVIFDGLVSAIKVGAPLMAAAIKGFLQFVLIGWRVNFGIIKGVVSTLWSVFKTTLDAIKAFASPVFTAIVGFVQAAWTRIRVIVTILVEIFKVVWAAIAPIVQPVLDWITSAVGAVVDAIGTAFSAVQDVVAPVFAWMGEAFAAVIDGITAALKQVLDGIAGAARFAAEALGVDMGSLDAKIAQIEGSVAPPPTSIATGGAVGQTAVGQAAGGGKGIGQQTNTATVGSVSVTIQGSTDMGPGQVAAATQQGAQNAMQSTVNEMARNAAGGAA